MEQLSVRDTTRHQCSDYNYALFVSQTDGQDFEDLGVIIHFNGNSDNSLGDSDPSAGAILFCLPVVQILNNLFVDGDVYFSISGEVQTDLAVEITQGSVAVHISDDDCKTYD